jgi:hypothetical protein
MARKTTPTRAPGGETKPARITRTKKKSPPRDEAQEFRDRLVKLVKLVSPEVERILEESRKLFPDGLGSWTAWPERVQDGLDLGEDGTEDLHAALSIFCHGNASATLLAVASRVQAGETFLAGDDGD